MKKYTGKLKSNKYSRLLSVFLYFGTIVEHWNFEPDTLNESSVFQKICYSLGRDTDKASRESLFAIPEYFYGSLPVHLYLVKEKRVHCLGRRYAVTDRPEGLSMSALRYGIGNAGLL